MDGISFAPTLLGQPQAPRPFLYRESPGYGGQQCVRVGHWKFVRQNLNAKDNEAKRPTNELYDLEKDPFETKDVSAQHLNIVAELAAIALEQHVPATLWPLPALDVRRKAQPPPAERAKIPSE